MRRTSASTAALLMSALLLAGCAGTTLTARKKMPGFEICSPYSEDLALVLHTRSRQYGYIDRQGALAIPARFADAQPHSEGLAAVQPGQWGKYGYIDRAGRLVIDASFDAAFPFSEGLARVKVAGRHGFIDKSGAVRIPARFDGAEAFSGSLAKVVQDGLAGFIDRSGQVVVRPVYYKAGRFRDGLAAACAERKCGFVDQRGQTAIAFQFDDVRDFAEGFAPARNASLWGYIDTAGKWLVEPRFHEAHEFRDGVALVSRIEQDPPDRGYGGYAGTTAVHGYLGRDGRFLIEPRLLRASSFSDGLARVQVPARGLCSDCYDVRYLRKNGSLLPRYNFGGDFHGGSAIVTAGASGMAGYLIDRNGEATVQFDRARFDDPERPAASPRNIRYGYLDRKGAAALPFQFTSAEPFSEGLALVGGREGNRRSRTRFIDRTGAVRLEIPATSSRCRSFSDGLALLSFYEKGVQRFAYWDREGEARIEGSFREAFPFSDGMAAVRASSGDGRNEWGYIDTAGRIAIPPRFNRAGRFTQGLAVVSFVDGAYLRGGVIDKTGKVVIESFYPSELEAEGAPEPRVPDQPAASMDLIPIRGRDGLAYAGRNGKIAVRNPRYLKGTLFSEGLAAVLVADGTRAGKWGYIDTGGRLAIEPRFAEAGMFSEGLALVRDETGRYGYIARTGAWAVEPAFFEEAHAFSQALALVKLNGLYGYIDRSGALAVRPRFVRAASFSEGLAAAGREE